MSCAVPAIGNYEDDVLTVLVQWLRWITEGVMTIRSHENGPRPDKQYLTVGIATDGEIVESRTSNHELQNGNVCETVSDLVLMHLDIHAFKETALSDASPGYSARDILRAIVTRARLSNFTQMLRDHCLFIDSWSPINKLPDLVNNDWEHRAHVLLHLYALVNASQELPRIGKVELGSCYEPGIITVDENLGQKYAM